MPSEQNLSADNEIFSTRLVKYSRELVFRAWTEPAQLKNWWGPKGFTNTFHEFDLRPGGYWRFVMHGPNGMDYDNESVFVEIVKPERLVFNHISAPQFQVVATFAEQEDKTLITFRMIFDSVELRNKIAVIAVPANEENFDRIEVELGKMQNG